MGFFDNFPYTNFHDINLDWIVKIIKECITKSTNAQETADTVNDKLDNFNIKKEVEEKLDEMAKDGSLQASITLKYPLKIVCISDSYGNTPANSNWIEQMKKRLPDVEIHSVAYGGAGFIGLKPEHTFIEELKESVSQVDIPTDITDVIVVGGYNDAHGITNKSFTYTELGNAIMEFGKKCATLYPNAKLHIGFAAWDFGGRYYSKTQIINLRGVLSYYTQSNRFSNNASIIGGLEYIMHYPSYFGEDLYHPSGEGSIALCNVIMNNLLGGTKYSILAPGSGYSIPSIIPSADINNYSMVRSSAMQIDGIISMELGAINFTTKSDTSVKIGGLITLGKLDNVGIRGSSGTPFSTYSTYSDGSGEYKLAKVLIQDGNIYFSPQTSAINGIQNIQLNAFQIICPIFE